MTAKEQMEQAGRAPILGWAQDRKIDLRRTDIRKTIRKVQRVLAQRAAEQAESNSQVNKG